jgi:hypothetical protein
MQGKAIPAIPDSLVSLVRSGRVAPVGQEGKAEKVA